MEAVAHNPSFAKSVGVPQNVGREFATADAARAIGARKPSLPTRPMPRKNPAQMAAHIMAVNPAKNTYGNSFG